MWYTVKTTLWQGEGPSYPVLAHGFPVSEAEESNAALYPVGRRAPLAGRKCNRLEVGHMSGNTESVIVDLACSSQGCSFDRSLSPFALSGKGCSRSWASGRMRRASHFSVRDLPTFRKAHAHPPVSHVITRKRVIC